MNDLELIFSMLDEAKTFTQHQKVAHEGGAIAGSARRKIEKRTGRKDE